MKIHIERNKCWNCKRGNSQELFFWVDFVRIPPFFKETTANLCKCQHASVSWTKEPLEPWNFLLGGWFRVAKNGSPPTTSQRVIQSAMTRTYVTLLKEYPIDTGTILICIVRAFKKNKVYNTYISIYNINICFVYIYTYCNYMCIYIYCLDLHTPKKVHSFLEWFICFPSLLPSSWGFRARHFWGWNFDMVVGGRCAWLNMEAAPVAKNHLHGYFVSLKEGVLTKSNRECASRVQNGFGCFLMDWIWIWIGPPGRDTPVLVVVVWAHFYCLQWSTVQLGYSGIPSWAFHGALSRFKIGLFVKNPVKDP